MPIVSYHNKSHKYVAPASRLIPSDINIINVIFAYSTPNMPIVSYHNKSHKYVAPASRLIPGDINIINKDDYVKVIM
jgi:hypothetical protein